VNIYILRPNHEQLRRNITSSKRDFRKSNFFVLPPDTRVLPANMRVYHWFDYKRDGLETYSTILQTWPGRTNCTGKLGKGAPYRMLIFKLNDPVYYPLQAHNLGLWFGGVKVIFARQWGYGEASKRCVRFYPNEVSLQLASNEKIFENLEPYIAGVLLTRIFSLDVIKCKLLLRYWIAKGAKTYEGGAKKVNKGGRGGRAHRENSRYPCGPVCFWTWPV
jgi:hypothetical protein